MSTLDCIERVLAETGRPLRVCEIVAHAGDQLPTNSKTPDSVVARDLWRDRQRGVQSRFVRIGTEHMQCRYALREPTPTRCDAWGYPIEQIDDEQTQ